MGTGIGGGYVVERKLISGLQSIAGEWGHSIIGSIGPKCYCGKIGCIETFISGTGVENKYFEMFQERLTMNEIVKRYRLGDNQAKLVMSDFFVYFGKAFSNLITILDPDIIILGGGLSNIDELYTIGVNRVRDFVFNDDLVTPIVRNKCGDSAGVLGAALLGI
jgi:fructokinase